jgi:hypothetical protein
VKVASARLLALAVFAASIVPFLPALSGEFLNWDDIAYIVDNPHWKGLSRDHLAWMFTTFEAGHYQPLSWLEPIGGWTPIAAAFGALFFAVHPLRTRGE